MTLATNLPTSTVDGADGHTDGHNATNTRVNLVATEVNAHESATTSVHGIADTAALETTTGSAAKVATHAAASDPHGDRAAATSAIATAVAAHAAATDPHGDRAVSLLRASNLSDLASASTARTNLGLAGAAVLAVGTSSGTVAAGDDSRVTGAAQKASNLSDLASAATARTNLGLGGAASLAVGTTTGTVAAGDDSRLPTTAQKAILAAMPPLLLIDTSAALPVGTVAGVVVVVKA